MALFNKSIPRPQRSAVLASCALVAVALGIIIVIVTLTTQATRPLTLKEDFNFNVHRRLTTLLDEDQALPPIFPFRWPQDYLGFGCAILGLLLAAGGGIGGGGILVPTYILVLEFPVKHAIPLASVTVLGGAIANNALNIRKVHPDHPERPAIDWDLILLLQPATIAGALIGADLNEELPEIALLVLMLLLLSVTAYKTLSKAFKMYREEDHNLACMSFICAEDTTRRQVENEFEMEGMQASKEDIDMYNLYEDVTKAPKIEDDEELIAKERNGTDMEVNNKTHSDYDESDRIAIKRQCIKDAIKLVSLFSVVTLLDLLQGTPDGGGGGPIGLISCGASCYWVSEVLMFLCIALFSLYVRSSIIARQESGGPIISEIHWNNHNTVVYPSLSIIAGLVAGMFGIGGGIIKGPLMLALGVHPQVASATSACMILFTSSTSTICFLISGYLVYDYAAFCLLLGFVSTLVGQTAMSALMESSGKRSSYIAFSIGGVVAISAVAMGIESVVAIFYS
mmetsp:Transcript_7424/g.16833  ORF Transcript_7424/g.16833 Transcript_7424/m.16833 type:complete len:511 (-) Transcript_7424:177-1709(-)